MPKERLRIEVAGTVQGVGFRPFVFNLAARFGLTGFVRNTSQGLFLEVQGTQEALEGFLAALPAEAPPQAMITGIKSQPCRAQEDESSFLIMPSRGEEAATAMIPPDLATCRACLQEILTPGERRYQYPFTNCTACGPRFTIIKGLPYDRPVTTMAGFQMCGACAAEYGDPSDRRFHAQPVACPDCGPKLCLLAPERGSGRLARVDTASPLAETARCLASGGIVALKGLGGMHLACAAADAAAVARLRSIKTREAKPFAVMCRDLEQVKTLCRATEADLTLLASAAAPIVILRRLAGAPVAAGVAPGQDTLGLMLPYTPLHHLLLSAHGGPLVMTSANPGEEPLARGEEELDPALRAELDLILTHDRPVQARCDDSVVRGNGEPMLVRRSRGYAPAPVTVPQVREAVGMGADQKNTVCFVRRNLAYLTQHIGDMSGEAAAAAQSEAIAHLRGLFGFKPALVGCDLHPAYYSRALAHGLGLPVLEIQHHHAHIAACLAENGLTAPALGVALDGSGYGPDETVWGGEFLLVHGPVYQRLASFLPVTLPGGEKAVREPWRMALSYLYAAFGRELPAFPGSEELYGRGADLLLPAVAARLQAPLTSSAGRLFDAAAALLGLYHYCTYEGQAAMALESMAARSAVDMSAYDMGIDMVEGLPRLDPRPAIMAMLADLRRGRPRAGIAGGFHLSLASGILKVCEVLRAQTGLSLVALSGGVFQNRLLLEETLRRLQQAGFTAVRHRLVPANDGGLSLGQAAIASAALNGG